MSGSAALLLPVLVVIALGYGVRRIGLLSEDGRVGVERLTYYLLFPALIVQSLANTDFDAFPALPLGVTLFSSVVAMAAICLALRPLLARAGTADGPAFTSLFQGAVRWNTFIGLAVAGSLYGSQGLALISVAIVAIVPMVNLMSVLVLARYASDVPPGAGGIASAVLRNPLIIACAIGLALSLSGLTIPSVAATTLDIVGRAGLAAGLIAVGAGLRLSALRRPTALLLLCTLLKLVVMPAIGLAIAWAVGLKGVSLAVAVIAMAVPTATASYVLAREMGGNAPLMAQVITFQTAVGVITLPLWIALTAQ